MTDSLVKTTIEVINRDGSDLLLRKLYYIDCYLSTFNKKDAADLAGFTGSPYVTFDRVMNDEVCREYLAQSLNEMALSKELVLARLGDIARGAYARYILETGDVDLPKLVADKKQFLIKKISWNAYGPQVEFFDPLHALDVLAKHYGITEIPMDDRDITLTVKYADSKPE